ncbi:MAG: type II secretion system protein [Candidatus Eremiobacteraeota bacterium]|nr:type II secretion system protein [Candidatus Eremiobacteraeota bacterium]
MKARGFSLTELLISTSIIVMLLIAVGAVIVQTLHVQIFHLSRAESSRTVSSLAERLSEEARTATAVFIPSIDVLGQPNGGSYGAHEVDFFRRLSAGGDAYVAYRFDAATQAVTRYEYEPSTGGVAISNSDLAASGVAGFSAEREAVSSSGIVAGTSDPLSVSINYGAPELVGGNDVIVVQVQGISLQGVPKSVTTIHLASHAAPTSLALLAPRTKPTPPPSTKTYPFIILRPGFPVTPPHGPMHGGGSGNPELLHWIAAEGTAQFLGAGDSAGGSWFELSSFYGSLTSGVYAFRDKDGSSITAIISCADGPCPVFRPLPVSAPGVTPGSLAFTQTP